MRIQFSNVLCNHFNVYALAYYNLCYEMKEYYGVKDNMYYLNKMINDLSKKNILDEDQDPIVITPPLFKCEPQLSLERMISNSFELSSFFSSKSIKYLSTPNMEFLNSPFPIEYQQHAFPIESEDLCCNEQHALVADPTTCRVLMNIMIASLRNLYLANWDFTDLERDSGDNIQDVAYGFYYYWSFYNKYGSMANKHNIVFDIDLAYKFSHLPEELRGKAIKKFILLLSRHKNNNPSKANMHTNNWYASKFIKIFRSKHNLVEKH